jgi:hypothetical protein
MLLTSFGPSDSVGALKELKAFREAVGLLTKSKPAAKVILTRDT